MQLVSGKKPLKVPSYGWRRRLGYARERLTVLLVEQNTGAALELAANPHIKTHYLEL